MAFWGVHLKPNEPYTLHYHHHTPNLPKRLRITQATLGEATRVSPVRSIVRCSIGDRPLIGICSLSLNLSCCQLDLEFEESNDVVFVVNGPRCVYLAGYLMDHAQPNHHHTIDDKGQEKPIMEIAGSSVLNLPEVEPLSSKIDFFFSGVVKECRDAQNKDINHSDKRLLECVREKIKEGNIIVTVDRKIGTDDNEDPLANDDNKEKVIVMKTSTEFVELVEEKRDGTENKKKKKGSKKRKRVDSEGATTSECVNENVNQVLVPNLVENLEGTHIERVNELLVPAKCLEAGTTVENQQETTAIEDVNQVLPQKKIREKKKKCKKMKRGVDSEEATSMNELQMPNKVQATGGVVECMNELQVQISVENQEEVTPATADVIDQVLVQKKKKKRCKKKKSIASKPQVPNSVVENQEQVTTATEDVNNQVLLQKKKKKKRVVSDSECVNELQLQKVGQNSETTTDMECVNKLHMPNLLVQNQQLKACEDVVNQVLVQPTKKRKKKLGPSLVQFKLVSATESVNELQMPTSDDQNQQVATGGCINKLQIQAATVFEYVNELHVSSSCHYQEAINSELQMKTNQLQMKEATYGELQMTNQSQIKEATDNELQMKTNQLRIKEATQSNLQMTNSAQSYEATACEYYVSDSEVSNSPQNQEEATACDYYVSDSEVSNSLQNQEEAVDSDYYVSDSDMSNN